MKMKLLPILIALMMLGSASVLAYGHSNPTGPLGALSFEFATLNSSPSGSGPLYASGGWLNASGSNIGKISYTVQPVEGTYQYNGKPYIASTITSDGTSSNFGLVVDGNITIYATASSDATSTITISVTFYTNITIQGDANAIGYYQKAYNYNIPFTLVSSTVTQPFSLNIVPVTTITGAYNSIVDFSVHAVTSSNPSDGWGFYGQGSFNSITMTSNREVYILPATVSLQQPKTPIQQGTQESIFYSTGYAPANSQGQAYALEIFGSPAYNGGSLLKTVYIGQNIGNGEYTYAVPSNAFVKSTQLNANQFKVELLDINVGAFPLVEKEFFTIDNYSYEPPKPTMTILNAPSNGQYYSGQTVTIQINYYINSITKTPINYVDVWVYSAISSSQPAEYIINDVPYKVTTSGNGTLTVSFQVPDNPNSLYISAIAVDEYGRSSQMGSFYISSYDIHTTHPGKQPVNLLEEIAFIIAIVAGSVLMYLYLPMDILSKGIIIAAWVGSILIIMSSYLPGVI